MLTDPQQPLVSVIIPTYNRPQYLQAAIASALGQTYRNLEVIVSDDGSAESPEAIVDAFRDSRLRLRRNPQNLGIGQNAMLAFQAAQGKYVASLNDDDVWHAQFLEQLVAPLEANSDWVLAFCDYAIIDAKGALNPELTEQQTQREKRDRLQPGVHQPFWKIGLVDQSVFTACAAVIRRDAIAWEELADAGVFWDYFLTYLACRANRGAYYCPEKLAFYRVHPQSENMVSGSRNAQAKIRKGKAGIACYTRFMADAPTPELQRHFQRELAHANTTLGIGLLRSQEARLARSYLLRSLQYAPFSLRTLLALVFSVLPEAIAHPVVHLRNPNLLSKAR